MIIVEALHQVSIILLLAAVMLLPGWFALVALRIDTAIDILLRPAAALMLTLLLQGVVLCVTLSLKLALVYDLAAVALLTLALAITARRSLLSSVAASIRYVRQHPRRRLSVPMKLTVLAATIAAVFGAIVGGYMEHDRLYHAAVALKLEYLAHPDFSSTQRFIDGGVNPAYALPAWHEAIAQTAVLGHVSPATVIWLSPALFAPIYVLATAGLARTLHQSTWINAEWAAPVGAWLLLAIEVFPTAPYLPMLKGAMVPGEIVFYAILPLLGALLVSAMDPTSPEEQSRRRGIALMTILALFAIGVLHANYYAYAGMLIIGYVVARLSTLPWTKSVSLRIVRVAATWVAFIAVGIVLLLPVLAKLAHFGRGSGKEPGEAVMERFGPILRGTPSSFHLDPGSMLHDGGLTILAMACLPLVWTLRHTRAFWYLFGATLPLLVVSQSDLLFGLLVGSGSSTAGIRMDRAIPFPQLLLVGVFVAAWIAKPLATSSRFLRIGATLTAWFAVAVIVTQIWPIGGLSLGFDSSDFAYPGIVASSAMIAGLLITAVLFARSFLHRDDLQRPAAHSATGLLVLIMATATVMGSWTGAQGTATTLIRDLRHRPANADSVDKLAHFSVGMKSALRDLPTSSVVMASPHMSYDIMAIAPLYVVGDFKIWQADTPTNDTRARLADVESFYDDDTSDSVRREILDRRHVTALLSPRAGDEVVRWAVAHPELFTRDPLVRAGNRTVLWHVNRDAL